MARLTKKKQKLFMINDPTRNLTLNLTHIPTSVSLILRILEHRTLYIQSVTLPLGF